MLLICSTRPSVFPEEWGQPAFWAGWEAVYVGLDSDEAGELLASRLFEIIGRDSRRARVPQRYGKDWTSFWQGDADLPEFTVLLRDAPVSSHLLGDEADEEGGYGRFAYKPIRIDGAYHQGHLYYTVQILSRAADVVEGQAGGRTVRDVERLETVVVRSDRTVHSAVLAPAPRGTRERERVMRLTDGTLVDREPRPNKYGTWSWPSIKAYLDGRAKVRPLADILRDVAAHLKASVWLPNEEDYSLLTLTIPVTYAQAVFDSVPLILLTGPAGSGKSEMGRAMARVCCNAYVCGQSSAASIARFIDESRGVGDVLGTRMLKVQTRKIPEHLREEFGGVLPTESARLERLRDELHTWDFESVGLIESTYRSLYPRTSDRADEIVAPLYVMASIAGDTELRSRLEVALARQRGGTLRLDDPEWMLREALKNLVAQGYDTVSPTHLSLEIRRLIGCHGGAAAEDVPEWVRPGWVGRMLRGLGVIDEAGEGLKRERVFGLNLRFYPLRASYLAQVKEGFSRRGTEILVGTKRPTDFCGECASCPFASHDCEIMWKRQAARG